MLNRFLVLLFLGGVLLMVVQAFFGETVAGNLGYGVVMLATVAAAIREYRTPSTT